jgi:hypothetical protein
MEPWVIAVVAIVVLVVLVVVVMFAMRGKGEGEGVVEGAVKPPQPAPVAPPAVSPAMMSPAVTSPAPVTAPRAESRPQAQSKPVTLQVEALSPSMTDEAPMLGAEEGELKIGTDEMPKFGTAELPALPEGKGNYRTPAAQKLSDSIASGNCPKCSAPTFVGAETSQGDNMFKLEARCGACGHKASVIDMRV